MHAKSRKSHELNYDLLVVDHLLVGDGEPRGHGLKSLFNAKNQIEPRMVQPVIEYSEKFYLTFNKFIAFSPY